MMISIIQEFFKIHYQMIQIIASLIIIVGLTHQNIKEIRWQLGGAALIILGSSIWLVYDLQEPLIGGILLSSALIVFSCGLMSNAIRNYYARMEKVLGMTPDKW